MQKWYVARRCVLLEDDNYGIIIMNNCFICWMSPLHPACIRNPKPAEFIETAKNTTRKNGKYIDRMFKGLEGSVFCFLQRENLNSCLLSIPPYPVPEILL